MKRRVTYVFEKKSIYIFEPSISLIHVTENVVKKHNYYFFLYHSLKTEFVFGNALFISRPRVFRLPVKK